MDNWHERDIHSPKCPRASNGLLPNRRRIQGRQRTQIIWEVSLVRAPVHNSMAKSQSTEVSSPWNPLEVLVEGFELHPRPYLISSREYQPHSRDLRTLWLRGILSLCWHWRLPRILIWEIHNVLRRHCTHLHLLPAYQTLSWGSKPSLCAFLATIIVLLFVSSKSRYLLLKPSWSHWGWQRGHWYLIQYNQLLSCLTSTFIIDLVPY